MEEEAECRILGFFHFWNLLGVQLFLSFLQWQWFLPYSSLVYCFPELIEIYWYFPSLLPVWNWCCHFWISLDGGFSAIIEQLYQVKQPLYLQFWRPFFEKVAGLLFVCSLLFRNMIFSFPLTSDTTSTKGTNLMETLTCSWVLSHWPRVHSCSVCWCFSLRCRVIHIQFPSQSLMMKDCNPRTMDLMLV